MNNSVKYFSSEKLDQLLSYKELVSVLKTGFQSDYIVPQRMHLDYQMPAIEEKNTLLLMPAISRNKVGGVKIVTVNPGNSKRNLPGIHGMYYLFDGESGLPLALIDAKALTNWRTATSSALAASFLARKDPSNLLMIGTGDLSSYLIDAHAAINPIEELLIWGRSTEKAERLAKQKEGKFKNIQVIEKLEDSIGSADIISAATMSVDPLILGEHLRPGQHIDLVGSYRPDMREADDSVMQRSNIYVDSIEMAPKESGDLAIPLSNGVIATSDIKGDLFQLCKSEIEGRKSVDEITVFKSVGHALEDLVTAEYLTQLD